MVDPKTIMCDSKVYLKRGDVWLAAKVVHAGKLAAVVVFEHNRHRIKKPYEQLFAAPRSAV